VAGKTQVLHRGAPIDDLRRQPTPGNREALHALTGRGLPEMLAFHRQL
jgi:hypothetical protein